MGASAEPAWAAGPPSPVLAVGAVHVWRADLDADPQLGELLCAEEQARAARLVGARHRQRWTHSREVLRALLGLYLDTDPVGLRFSLGVHGKPSLDPPTISFNLSHSGDVGLYAVSSSGDVGVDVELQRETTDVMAVAARTFDPQEVAHLQALGERERTNAFLRAWVRHEAELKRLGIGLLRSDLRAVDRAAHPWIRALDVGSEAAGAVALERRPSELCCWTWPPADSG
jgi:4'-phosphopantetheinyl transferase